MTDDLILWFLIFLSEWFFLAKKKEKRNYGLENLGWFLIIITGFVGIWIFEDGGNYFAFILGGVMALIGLVNFIKNLGDDYV